MAKILNLPTRNFPLVEGCNDLIFQNKLGEGAFGQVFKIKIRNLPGIFAVKIVKLTRLNYII